MILNHASLTPATWHAVVDWLAGAATGMAGLVRGEAAHKMLRMSRSVAEISWPNGSSLFDAYLQLRQQGARDQFAFLMGLSAKAPLLSDVEPAVTDRFRMCEVKDVRTAPGSDPDAAREAISLLPNDGEPLVLCAVGAGIAVSFPSQPVWGADRIQVVFDEMLPTETINQAEEEIDNLARPEHVNPILVRHRKRLRYQCTDAAGLWEKREQIFPNLVFGPDVEGHVAGLNAGWLSTLSNKLAALDETVEEWRNAGGDDPPWKTRVTPESASVRNNPTLREARRFRSTSGEAALFEWHARFGSGARIHLRFDAGRQQIEIGYIGGHLPT